MLKLTGYRTARYSVAKNVSPEPPYRTRFWIIEDRETGASVGRGAYPTGKAAVEAMRTLEETH